MRFALMMFEIVSVGLGWVVNRGFYAILWFARVTKHTTIWDVIPANAGMTSHKVGLS